MADLVIGHLQRFTARLHGAPQQKADSRRQALLDQQPFLLEMNWGHTHTACVLEDDFPQLVKRSKVGSRLCVAWQGHDLKEVPNGLPVQRNMLAMHVAHPGSKRRFPVSFRSRRQVHC